MLDIIDFSSATRTLKTFRKAEAFSVSEADVLREREHRRKYSFNSKSNARAMPGDVIASNCVETEPRYLAPQSATRG
jgi:hypothetical protein